MKKAFALVLSLAMLCMAPLAFAQEEMTVEVNYEGNYIPFDDFNFQIYLPSDWLIYEPENGVYFMAGNEDQTQYMWLEVYESEGYTMDSLLAELETTEGYSAVMPIYFNNIPFVTYQYDAEGMFGATTLTEEADYMVFFKFFPVGEESLGELATMIMASLVEID